MIAAARKLVNASAHFLRRARRSKRFNRTRAAAAIAVPIRKYWAGGVESLFAFLDETKGWEQLQRFARGSTAEYGLPPVPFRKELTPDERVFLQRLLAEWGYYGDIDQVAAAIAEGGRKDVYEQAATFALGQLGVKADFELKNERILDALKARGQADIFASRKHIDRVFDVVIRNFYDLGSNPFDRKFLDELKSELNYKTDYEAKRFALTETGIAAETAQIATWRRSGVTQKMWRVLGVNTRPTHQALDKVTVGIDEKFIVGGYEADHPLDASLPPEELVNCHCWSKPVVPVDFQIDPGGVWDGR